MQTRGTVLTSCLQCSAQSRASLRVPRHCSQPSRRAGAHLRCPQTDRTPQCQLLIALSYSAGITTSVHSVSERPHVCAMASCGLILIRGCKCRCSVNVISPLWRLGGLWNQHCLHTGSVSHQGRPESPLHSSPLAFQHSTRPDDCLHYLPPYSPLRAQHLLAKISSVWTSVKGHSASRPRILVSATTLSRQGNVTR